MNTTGKNHSFGPLFFTNLWGVLNDNFLKSLACFVAVKWVSPEYETLLISLAAGALVLPYLLLSPLADRLTHRFRKVRVVRLAKWAELPIIALAVAGFCFHSVATVIAAIVLMGVQSALYSPSKFGLVRDIGGLDRVSVGMGGMEAIGFAGMLLGTVLAAFAADHFRPVHTYLIMGASCLLGLGGAYWLHAEETPETEQWPVNPLKFFVSSLRKADQYEGLPPVLFVLSWFWWMAALMQMSLLVYCQHRLGLDSFHTGLVMALAAVGITAGCWIAGKIDQKWRLLRFGSLLGMVLAVEFVLLFALPWTPMSFSIALLITTLTAGCFKIPLDAEIQRSAKGPTLNLMLAFFNQLSFLFILLASATLTLLCLLLDIRFVFLLIALVLTAVSLYLLISHRVVLTATIDRLLLHRYDIRVSGRKLLQDDTTKLILPNHSAVIDPIIVFSHFYDCHMRPLVDEAYFEAGAFRRILQIFDAIRVPDLRKSRQGVGQVRQLESLVLESLAQGHNVIFYPSGHITLDG
ncbi:MAG: MFS transporter, partial [Paludibacteraceae bacterium]|nr:MFS transporter [Paludibacteraceae bacterium]